MRISYLLADFLGKKVFLQQNNPNNNRKTTDKWSITLGLAQASVSLEVQQSEGSTGVSTVNQLTVTLNLLKMLMVKRAKFSLTMCNLRSKQGILQKFIRKSFAVSKNMHTFAETVPTTLPICTANQGGTFAFYSPTKRIFKDGT